MMKKLPPLYLHSSQRMRPTELGSRLRGSGGIYSSCFTAGLIIIFIAANTISSAAFGQKMAETPPPMATLQTVDRVELSRYLGKWHEIALYPNRFQAQCLADTTATYALKDNSRIEVKNRCKLADGKYDEALGEAKFPNAEVTTKLKVRFAPWYLSFLPQVWGDYWVIDLDANYQYAVVSEPSRKFLWILSRTPKLDDATLQGIKTRLTAMGFDPMKLQFKPQSGL
jgi:apolipoprotein D and lipocalin family protein